MHRNTSAKPFHSSQKCDAVSKMLSRLGLSRKSSSSTNTSLDTFKARWTDLQVCLSFSVLCLSKELKEPLQIFLSSTNDLALAKNGIQASLSLDQRLSLLSKAINAHAAVESYFLENQLLNSLVASVSSSSDHANSISSLLSWLADLIDNKPGLLTKSEIHEPATRLLHVAVDNRQVFEDTQRQVVRLIYTIIKIIQSSPLLLQHFFHLPQSNGNTGSFDVELTDFSAPLSPIQEPRPEFYLFSILLLTFHQDSSTGQQARSAILLLVHIALHSSSSNTSEKTES